VDYVFALHVAEDIQHLSQEVATSVFAHSAAGLAKIEEKATWNILEEDVDKVLDLSTRWFLDISV
jgi:hypothetical protein